MPFARNIAMTKKIMLEMSSKTYAAIKTTKNCSKINKLKLNKFWWIFSRTHFHYCILQ